MTWFPDRELEAKGPQGIAWVWVILRLVLMAVGLLLGLALMAVLRLFERPLFGDRRPLTPWITLWVCRWCLLVIGLRHSVVGEPARRSVMLVANHVSWLDIFVLNAAHRLYFVSKAEVASWPGIGWLARATGTLFIRRDRREAAAQTRMFQDRLTAGHRLLLFPEGTSTDGRRVLPFKPTLFAALFAEGLEHIAVQPVSLVYEAPAGADPRFYGWIGEMGFGEHLLAVLARWRQGRVQVVFHPTLDREVLTDRKAIAAAAEAEVRRPLAQANLLDG